MRPVEALHKEPQREQQHPGREHQGGARALARTKAEVSVALERLRACDVIVLRRRHERYWGPVCGFVREDGQLELRVTVELDHSPLEDGALSSWFTNGVEHCRFMAAWSATR